MSESNRYPARKRWAFIGPRVAPATAPPETNRVLILNGSTFGPVSIPRSPCRSCRERPLSFESRATSNRITVNLGHFLNCDESAEDEVSLYEIGKGLSGQDRAPTRSNYSISGLSI